MGTITIWYCNDNSRIPYVNYGGVKYGGCI